MNKEKLNQEENFTIFLLNSISKENDVAEKWTFSYKHYNFHYIEEENIVRIYNNLGHLIKTFSNVLINY
jgi:hypothetical protein